MSRMLVVERDAARREGLVSALAEAGFRAKGVSLAEVAGQLASHRVELLLVGDGDLRLLDDLPRNGDEFTVPVLTLVDLGNVSGILASLSAGASGFLSRDSSPDQIVAKVRSLLRPVDLNDSDPHQITILGDGTLTERTYRPARLVEALEAACDEIRALQLRYEEEQLQRRKVEQALMESEAFYQSLVETLPMAMFRKDLQGHVTFANRLLCEAFRRPSEEIIGRTDYDFFPRDLAEKYRIDDRRVVESRENFETTEEFQAQDGERRFTHVVKTPVYDASGNPVGVQGIFSDVTEKERAEIELHQTKTRLEAVLNAATQMSVIATDVNGLIDVFNTGAERMLGYSADEMIGKQTPAIFHLESEVQERGEEMSQQFGHPFQGIDVFVEYARRGQHEEREWTYVRKDGSQLTVNLVVTARRNREGQIEGFLGIATDISERKRAEEAMRKAKEAAEAASRAKSDFLANMSHEIRTPLNAVIGMTELVRDTELTATQREYLGMVQESGESLLAVINDILDFSKIEAGKMSLEEVPFNLREVLGDTMKSLALRAHRKRLELACHVAPDVPFAVAGDPHRLRQIVVNLVGNAIKFTEVGEVVLDVAVQELSEDGLVLHFRVQDTGIGIPQNKLDTIFEAFEQADTSTTRRYGGTGLGLAIVSSLVELMEGNIWVESEVLRGSVFHFTARYRRASAENIATATTIHPPMLSGLRVLVVDDNSTNRRILTEMLTNWAMHPLAVSSVADALDELERMSRAGTPYALILTDSNMPVQDGFELAERIQSNRTLCGPMIMMLTSADRPDDLAKCDKLGIAAYLIKPVKQSELLDAIVLAVGADAPTGGSVSPNVSSKKVASNPRSILLAEDSLINQKLAIGLLERWGHTVTVANNGEEAVRLSHEQRFDLILMDVQMPEMDGLDATLAIRARERESGLHIPIVAMTAHAMKGDRERCLEVGMDGYLVKPIRAEQLFRQIEDISGAAAVSKSEVDCVTENGTVPGANLVDWKVAHQAVNGDVALLEQVLAAFLEEGPQLLKTMRLSSAAEEWKPFQRAAHTLKSALRTFGVASADLVEELELTAKSGNTAISPETVAQITELVQPALDEMQRRLNSRGAGVTI